MSARSRGAAFLCFLVSLSLTSSVNIIREEGRCLWSGQCTDDLCPRTPVTHKFYNIFNNSWALNVTEATDKELYDLIEENCPMYIDQTTSTAHVCCTAPQVRSLRDQIAQAQSLISRCPACLKNFVQHYCVIACDPNASQFMDGKIITSTVNSSIQIVENVTVYLTNEYADDLYDSCADVQFAGGGAKVMNLLCGSPTCNPYEFLTFQGDPNQNGVSPFKIGYHWCNDTDPVGDLKPLTDNGTYEFYSCNDSVPDLGTCSCSDCPVVCPAPPTFPQPHFPFKTIAWSVGATGVFISSIVFIAALTSSLYFWLCRRKSGYQQIAREDSPLPKSTYGATAHSSDNAEKESSTNSNLNSDVNGNDFEPNDTEEPLSRMERCCQVGHYVERYIKLVFYHWGRFVAKFWYLVLIVTIVIAGVLSFGLFFFTVTTDPVKLWSAPTSRARLEKNYYDENFRPFYRTEQIIVKAKPFVRGFNITPVGTKGLTWTFGPVFDQDLLKEVLSIQNHLANMNVTFNDGNGTTYITLSDICFSPLAPENTNCTIESVLNYFQNDESRLDYVYKFFYNYAYHIHYCTRFPFSQNETQSHFNIPCVGAYGGDIDPKVTLGGFKKEKDGPGYDYDTSTVLIVTFVVNNHLHDDDNKMAMAWEQKMLDYLHDYKEHHTQYIDIEFSTERSIVDEINRESETDVVTIIVSYLLMFLYITICLGHIRSIKTICVDSKIGVGLVGVLLVLFAVTSSLGMYSFAKLEASLIILEVVPFLVLAVGVDNLFILVHSYERQVKLLAKKYGCNWEQIPTAEIIGRAVGDVAPSLLLTGLSETAAFLLGAVSIMPAVRAFSLYAGTAVFFNLLLQLSIFVAVMALDAMRQLRNRVDIAPCVALAGKFDPRLGLDFLSIAMKYFADAILFPLVRPFILLFFGLTLTTSLIFMCRIEIGLNQNLALPKDSYLIPYFNELFANLHTGSPVYFVIRDGANYTSPPTQDLICSSAGCSEESLGNQITIYARAPNESGIAESPLNWLDSYFAWLSFDGGCCGYYKHSASEDSSNLVLCDKPENGTDCVPCIMSNRPNAEEFGRFIKYFLAANPNATCASAGHAAFGDAVILKDNRTATTSYVMTYHSSLQTSSQFINALKRARELSDNVTRQMDGRLEVFPYSVFYVYYEQYLTIVQDMLLNIGLALAAVFLVSFLLTGFNLWAAVVILFIVTSIILHMLGSMAVLGINANAVSLVNLVMTVGIAVEFCAHIVRWFVSCSLPTRVERAHSALHHMGASVFSGITVTKFLGVFVLLFAKSQLFEIYYFRMYMCMLLWGALHGLVLLPVILSYVGPPYFINTLKSPYNDSNIRNVPTIPPNNDQQNPPPVTSYDPVDHTPSAPTPPPNYQNHHQYNGYAPPTRLNATQPHEATFYPDLQALHQEEQVYPAATWPYDGYSQVDEKSRLLTN